MKSSQSDIGAQLFILCGDFFMILSPVLMSFNVFSDTKLLKSSIFFISFSGRTFFPESLCGIIP